MVRTNYDPKENEELKKKNTQKTVKTDDKSCGFMERSKRDKNKDSRDI